MGKIGLIQIYTGPGKGKTTAALGLTLRAAGWGMRSAIVRFMKKDEIIGEMKASINQPLIDIYSFGKGHFLYKGDFLDNKELISAQNAIIKTKELMCDPKIDILVLDELTNAIYFSLIKEDEVLDLLSKKRKSQEIVITGRNASSSLMNLADLVTEMHELKHPYRKGIKARRGIDY